MPKEQIEQIQKAVTELRGKCEKLPAPSSRPTTMAKATKRKGTGENLKVVTPPMKQSRSSIREPVRKPTKRGARYADVLDDALGKHIEQHTQMFTEMNWRDFIRTVRGLGDLRMTEAARSSHPAGDLIIQFERNGVPAAIRTAPWTQELRDERSKRGSHKSCQDYLDFLRGEILDYVEKGFWMLLPYRVIRHLHHLRLSPMGVVPQRERRPRLIVDYSFYGVNQDTIRLTPPEAMQFGRALERILYHIRKANPRYGPVYLGKVDLADGFYRLRLTDGSILKLAVAFPKYPGEEQMVALPLSIPMGWVESPPAFCAVTETVADLANHYRPSQAWPEHPLEETACTRPEGEEEITSERHIKGAKEARRIPPPLITFRHPVKFNDVYVDDFLLGFQGHARRRRLHLRNILHVLDMVFRPLEPNDRPTRKHVASIKKLLKGDAYLSVTKVVLGWFINTAAQTIELPPHRKERLHEIFTYLKGRSSVHERKWHKILGELRSMVIGIPGSRGLFSLLQLALQRVDASGNIIIDRPMRDQLDDFEYLANDLATRPTAIAELVPDYPIAVGPHDASGTGMGGAWLPATTNTAIEPIMWRKPFPPSIVNELVTDANPTGTVNNSQLELAGQVAHQDVLLQAHNCAYRTIIPFGDNTTAVAWSHKGSATTLGPTAYLLRLNSLHQRHFRYLSKPDYIPGVYNCMADDLSRLWHLSDSQLLAYFNSRYPQPQPWKLVHLRPAMYSSLISALQMKSAELPSVLNEPQHKIPIGRPGSPSARPLVSTPTWKPSPTSYLYSKFFAVQLRSGDISPSGLPLRSRTVEDFLRTVGAEIASVGAENPRLTVAGRVVPGLAQLQAAWKKEDPPPERVKPIPIQLVRHAVLSLNQNNPLEAAIADAIIIGFFYMLRPGEHTLDRSNYHPFRLQDVSFAVHNNPSVNACIVALQDFMAQNRVFLNFTTQKNGEKNEAITHGSTSDSIFCPVAAVRRRVLHLRHHHAPPDTPLYMVFLPTGPTPVLASQLTHVLRRSCDILGPSLGINRREISARALRAGGAMALVRANVDLQLVMLMGRWKSDVMLRYLHRSVLHTAGLASLMLHHGEFVIPHHQTLPSLPIATQQLVDTLDPSVLDLAQVPTLSLPA